MRKDWETSREAMDVLVKAEELRKRYFVHNFSEVIQLDDDHEYNKAVVETEGFFVFGLEDRK